MLQQGIAIGNRNVAKRKRGKVGDRNRESIGVPLQGTAHFALWQSIVYTHVTPGTHLHERHYEPLAVRRLVVSLPVSVVHERSEERV